MLEHERSEGQRFLFDVELEVGEAGSSDEIEDAVDYRDVVACVREVSDGRAYRLLEALAAAVADELRCSSASPSSACGASPQARRRLDPPVESGRGQRRSGRR